MSDGSNVAIYTAGHPVSSDGQKILCMNMELKLLLGIMYGLGGNTVVVPGVHRSTRYSSVVTKDIPDWCVAAAILVR